MVGSAYHLHPVVRFVRSLEGEFYLRQEVAIALQCSTGTLALLAKKPGQRLGPSHHVAYGELDLLLYTPDDIERIRQYRERKLIRKNGTEARRLGRPRMWTAVESVERGRKQDKVRYWLAKTRDYHAAGSHELEARALAKAEQLMHELAVQFSERKAEMVPGWELRESDADIDPLPD